MLQSPVTHPLPKGAESPPFVSLADSMAEEQDNYRRWRLSPRSLSTSLTIAAITLLSVTVSGVSLWYLL